MTYPKPTHTPGPWEVYETTFFTHVMNKTEEAHICEVKRHNPANARLIAAAPELYEALNRIVELERGERWEGWHLELMDAVRQARATLRKVEDES